MSRFYVLPSQVDTCSMTVSLEGNDAVHFGNVLRAKKGDKCEIISGDGHCYQCSVTDFCEGNIILSIEGENEKDYEPSVRITLYQCIPKGEKTELVIQKAVELGVSRIVPVLSERSVVKINSPQDAEKKTARWNKIAAEAAKQCGRGEIPVVCAPVKLFNLSFEDESVKILPYENESETSLKSVITDAKISEECLKNGISFIVGPEGGFDPKEASYLVSNGFRPVTLGKRILRTETAPIMVMSAIRFFFED